MILTVLSSSSNILTFYFGISWSYRNGTGFFFAGLPRASMAAREFLKSSSFLGNSEFDFYFTIIRSSSFLFFS